MAFKYYCKPEALFAMFCTQCPGCKQNINIVNTKLCRKQQKVPGIFSFANVLG